MTLASQGSGTTQVTTVTWGILTHRSQKKASKGETPRDKRKVFPTRILSLATARESVFYTSDTTTVSLVVNFNRRKTLPNCAKCGKHIKKRTDGAIKCSRCGRAYYPGTLNKESKDGTIKSR